MKKIYSFLAVLLCNIAAFSQIQIISNPQDEYVCNGQSVTFSVMATGDNLQYQWYFNGDVINEATAAAYTIPSVIMADSGNYYCVVSNTNDVPVSSAPATLIVNESTIIISQTEGVNVCYGDPIVLTVTASGNNLTYQWFKGNSSIVDGFSNSYTIPFADFSSVGNFSVEVMNACQTVISANIVVTVNTPPQISAVNVQPEACAGDNVNLSVSASGTNLTYQWFHDDVLVASQNSFSIANCSAADSGIYQIIVKNGCSEIFSYTNLNVNTPVAPNGEANQAYTQGETLANLDVSGVGITWYATAADATDHVNALPMTTLLQDGVTYFATETLSGMCESDASFGVTASLNLGIGNLENAALDYYPNPVATVFNFSSKEKINSINIVNMLGQRVASESVNALSGKVDLAMLPNGNYIAEFSFEGVVKRVKLVKK